MKIRRTMFCVLFGLLIVSGCTSTKSIASLNNGEYFKESPTIASYKGRYFMRFVYSDNEGVFAFFMMPQSKVNSDSLIYYLPVTSSSGDLKGKTQFQEIIKENEIEIIKKKKVFWEEPDGSLVVMFIEQLKDEEIKLLPRTEIEKEK
ncbi:MAG: hypothetical protein ABJG78_20115 [Cyclobacteriaceae bacterium]